MAKIYIPTFGEEVGNTISHGVMSILMLIAMPFAAASHYIAIVFYL
jgi:hemolysin III